jgi:hypothetical protein
MGKNGLGLIINFGRKSLILFILTYLALPLICSHKFVQHFITQKSALVLDPFILTEHNSVQSTASQVVQNFQMSASKFALYLKVINIFYCHGL